MNNYDYSNNQISNIVNELYEQKQDKLTVNNGLAIKQEFIDGELITYLIVKIDNNTIKFNELGELTGVDKTIIDNKTIIKNDNNEIAVSDLKQDKLISGANIKTINGNSLLGNGNISISGSNDWKLINYPEANEKLTFKITDYDLTKYYYKISISITNYASAGNFVTYYFETISQKSVFSFLADNSSKRITIEQDGSISNDTNNIVIKDLTIKRKLINNNELMADEPRSIYKRDMDKII